MVERSKVLNTWMLRAEMERRHLSIDGLATACSCSKRTISNALAAKRMSQPTIVSISKAMGLFETDLICDRRIRLGNLPSPANAGLFLGRKKVLKRILQAWNSNKSVAIQLVGDGGIGKSAVIWNWLKSFDESFEGVDQAFDWSFYRQGLHSYATDSHEFVESIVDHLSSFGLSVAEDERSNPVRLGEKIANQLGKVGGILILDGLEPIQNPPNVNSGRVRDPAVQQLIRIFQNCSDRFEKKVLLLITTRWPVPEIPTSSTIRLEGLTQSDGARLLKNFRVPGFKAKLSSQLVGNGAASAFATTSREFGGHPLALTLLASLLICKFNGDLNAKTLVLDLVSESDQESDRHARRVMIGYDRFMFPIEADSSESTQYRQALGVISLFDRPIGQNEFACVLDAKIPNVSDAISEYSISATLQKLCDLGLLTIEFGLINLHPLVREHFRKQLVKNFASEARIAHGVIFHQLAASMKHLPSSAQEMSPLYRAVFHGCQASLFNESFQIFEDKIYQGGLTWQKLGLINADLVALASFCQDPWQPSQELEPKYQGFILALGGFLLRCIGRIKEATQPLINARKIHESVLQDPKETANDLDNLAQCYFSLGEFSRCIDICEESTAFADQCETNPKHSVKIRVVTRSLHGHVLHYLNRLDEAETCFREAERIWNKEQGECRYLSAASGYRYCAFLLRKNRGKEVIARVSESEKWARARDNRLAIGFDCLSKGWARLQQARGADLKLKGIFEEALESIRAVNMVEHLPLALMGMADVNMHMGRFSDARMYLDEAMETCLVCDLRTDLCDVHLRYATCYFLTGRNRSKASTQLDIAKNLSQSLSYFAIGEQISAIEQRL